MMKALRGWWSRRREMPRVMGYRVFHDARSRALADSRGLWPFKRIIVGDLFFTLSPPEQGAVLLHEVGHCRLFHLEKRILALPTLFFAPGLLSQFCHEQEFEADQFAAAQGFAPWLVALYSRMTDDTDNLLHPTFESRIARLKAP